MYEIFISIHKALAGLDDAKTGTGLGRRISIHKALAGLDLQSSICLLQTFISIHKALAGLDFYPPPMYYIILHFNPQGPRGPRRLRSIVTPMILIFQSTCLLYTSDAADE